MIKGDLVSLRNVRKGDLEELYALSFDYQNAGEFMPVNLVSETEFFKAFAEDGFWNDHCGKLVIVNTQGQLVGEAGFFKAAHYLDGREIYYRIFTGHRGKGYAGSALALLLKLFFESTSMSRVQAVTVEGNSVSEHLLEKAGFSFEGTLRMARYFKGTLVNLKLFSLIREDYQNQ